MMMNKIFKKSIVFILAVFTAIQVAGCSSVQATYNWSIKEKFDDFDRPTGEVVLYAVDNNARGTTTYFGEMDGTQIYFIINLTKDTISIQIDGKEKNKDGDLMPFMIFGNWSVGFKFGDDTVIENIELNKEQYLDGSFLNQIVEKMSLGGTMKGVLKATAVKVEFYINCDDFANAYNKAIEKIQSYN